MYKLLLFVIIAAVSGNDLTVGNDGGRKIYNENKQATPAIWKQVQNITANATESEIISRVIVTDLRPNKDGEAEILEGGAGKKNVTIQLRSPSVFRGFDFNVEVFAVPDRSNIKGPFIMTDDIDVNTEAAINNDAINHPLNEARDVDDVTEAIESNSETLKPIDSERNTRDTVKDTSIKESEIKDHKVKYVNENVDVPKTNEHTNAVDDKVKLPAMLGKESEITTEIPVTEITISKSEETTETIQNTHSDKYSEVSKQVGQKIIYGIKTV